MRTNFNKLIAFMLLFTVVACGLGNDPDNSLPPMTDPDDVCSAMDDLKFMEYCYKNFDINKDGKVSPSEANAVLYIGYVLGTASQSLSGVHSLKGIEYFPNLKQLSFSGNVSSLNLSRNTKLEVLWCFNNELTSLDISNNTALACVQCQNNKLSANELNNILKSLHSNAVSKKHIHIGGNPGTRDCDLNFAAHKGWHADMSATVYFSFIDGNSHPGMMIRPL